MSSMRTCLVIVAALASMHCASSQRTFDTPPDAGPPPEGNLGEAGVDAGPDPIQGECTDENKQVYVVSTGGTGKTLYRFDPPALTFTKIGDIHCPTSADTFSMAVDRKGIAWVEYTDGQIFHVSTVDASCKETT